MSTFPYQKALVTGGAGFIGSNIIEELLRIGVEVVSIDNYSGGKLENLEGFENAHLLRAVNCDVIDYDGLKKNMDGVDVIFHNAASKKNICLNDPRLDLRINAEGAFNIMELARDFGVKKVVHASTGSVYGEAQYFPQDEKHPLQPASYYGVSKLAGEKYAKTFEMLYGLDTTVLRYFHVYGARQESSDDKGGVIAIFCRRALQGKKLIIHGDGSQQRSFTYVKDLVKANLIAATNPSAKGQAYNCASGIKVTIKELAQLVNQAFGMPEDNIEYGDWLTGDIKQFDVSNKKISELGLSDFTTFEVGLKETMKWYSEFVKC